jgi:hypothetical protein
LTKEGKVLVWGDNYGGQCATEKEQVIKVPTEIKFPSGEIISDIFLGGRHSVFLTKTAEITIRDSSEFLRT